MDMENYSNWLLQPPNFTTFRINILKNFDIDKLKHHLETQRAELNFQEIPNINYLRSDCLVIEQWPTKLIIDEVDNEVIVDALCAAAVLRGAHVFAPGVLGLSPNCKLGERVNILGDLDGKCKRGLKVKYDGCTQHVGTGYLLLTRRDLFDNNIQPSGIAVNTLLPASNLPVINETLFDKGVILLQNLPSIVCGWVVDAQPNEKILDMCAAPGNKTTHMAEMSQNKAFIIAIDKTNKKILKLEEKCVDHGTSCVRAFEYDSTKCYSDCGNKIIEAGPPFVTNLFDKVLLDAPCSGLGQRPQLMNKMTPKILQSYKFVQRKLLVAASKVLKVGGTMIYSTCTITEDENEKMIAWALEKIPCLKLTPAEPLLGGPGFSNAGLTDDQRLMVQRFGPEKDTLRPVSDIYRNGIGFFIAKFIKVNECNFHPD